MDGASTSWIGKATKSYIINDSVGSEKPLFDWGFGLEARANTNISASRGMLIEAFLKARIGPFDFRAGRSRETMGITGDTTLTSGSFANSGNSLGIPKITVAISDFTTLPILKRLFAIKGSFAHGWLGSQPLQPVFYVDRETNEPVTPLNPQVATYFHQKSFYGRLGRESWPVKLLAGFNHQAFWGNERKIYSNHELSRVETFLAAATGAVYHSSKIGNHLGSIDVAVELEFERATVLMYRQNLYDVGALYHLANLRDGLNGFQISLKERHESGFNVQTVLLEVVNTKSQAGEVWAKPTPSGDENYYNHAVYLNGWSYLGYGLGMPFISTNESVKETLPTIYFNPRDKFINNRLFAVHLGLKARYKKWHYIAKVSHSKNYGTYGTSPWGHSPGLNKPRYPASKNIFAPLYQTSFFLQSERTFKNNLSYGITLAADRGELLQNSFGAMLKVSKKL